MVLPVWDDIGLARQTRDPEAVNHIFGLQGDEGWLPELSVADRHVQFVRSRDAIFRIMEFPPPLVPRGGDGHPALGLLINLDFGDCANRHQREHEHGDQGNDGPCHLQRVTAVDLRRLAVIVSGAFAKTYQGDDAHRHHHHEDCGTDPQHEIGEVLGDEGWGRNPEKTLVLKVPVASSCASAADETATDARA